ncbi:nucleotidyltransferase [uncultured Roseobacter sp.]|uniref:nucleotidyltransferase domain-containing protein n=1 Tax=uncultured Roseobacter sp. TaxID=114847 RepID=UPI00262097B7|nr:nucleotidyltransferase [uncultured Roseobacter sp.]
MNKQLTNHDEVLEAITATIDIPEHLDERARKRYRSLGDWLDRPNSGIKQFDPEVYPQGSFALGTVIQPISEADAFDLDLVCRLDATKYDFTMQELKRLTGIEVLAYADAHSMKHTPEDKRRCWTMEYADEANFHTDILPALPDDVAYREYLKSRGHVDLANNDELAQFALAITDKTHPSYERTCADWPVSNPKGYATWFHAQHSFQLDRAKKARMAKDSKYASIDEIPNYRMKTPLQRSIQLLKRHRDMMFADDGEHKPISIIITTLSAHAYQGEETITDALRTILRTMDTFIEERGGIKWIANPTNPEENFADKWPDNAEKETNFYDWLEAARHDFGTYIREARFSEIPRSLQDRLGSEAVIAATAAIAVAAPHIVSATVAAGEAEVDAVKQSGAETRPWAK